MRHLALFSLLLAGAFGQVSQVPYATYGDGTGPTFTSENASLSLPGSYTSIRKVNFRKLTAIASVKNRHVKDSDPDDHYSERSGSVFYLDGSSSSSTGGSALVLSYWSDAGGSSSQAEIAQVFTVSDGHLRSVQSIRWDTHFQTDQPTKSYDPNTSTLVIRSAHYIPGDAHCCVSARRRHVPMGRHSLYPNRYSDRAISVRQERRKDAAEEAPSLTLSELFTDLHAASRTSTVICLPRVARAAWIFSAFEACSGSSIRRITRSWTPRRRANSELFTR